MDAVQFSSLAVATASVLAALLAYFKYKPGQRENVGISVAEATMNIAKGTITMVTTELEDQFKRMAAELTTIRGEQTELRAHLNENTRQLMFVTAERDGLHRENKLLRERVADLETRIARMEPRSDALDVRDVAQNTRATEQDDRSTEQDSRSRRQSARGVAQDARGLEQDQRMKSTEGRMPNGSDANVEPPIEP